MRRPRKRGERAGQRWQVAALNIAVMGLLLVAVPHLLGTSIYAAMFRPVAALGWALLLGGGAMTWLLRKKTPGDAPPNYPSIDSDSIQPATRTPRRPSRPLPKVERIEPAIPVTGALGEPPVARPTPTQWGPRVFGLIEWRRFEAVVEALFAQAGFQTKALSHGPDEGVDVWLYSKNQPDGAPVSVVQCKHWQSKRVGVEKVRELRGVMASKGVMRGQFATTSTFTSDAVAFAEANGIKLHDMTDLLAVIATRSPEQQQALLDVALEGDHWRPTCVNCGIKLVERESMAGSKPFWGCMNVPTCRTTMQKRVVA